MNLLKFLYILLIPLLISCNMPKFGDYKPIYFKGEKDLKIANDYINSLGYKTISEYTTKVNILDFPNFKEITIDKLTNLNDYDLRKDLFLKKLPNLFNLRNKKILYVESAFTSSDLRKLNQDKNIEAEMHSFNYKTKIKYFSIITFIIITILLLLLNIKYAPFIILFLISSCTIFIISDETLYFYPLTILSYLLFTLIDNFNKNYNKIYLRDISFTILTKKIKVPIFLFLLIVLYFIVIINFLNTNLESILIICVSISTLCIFLIFIWIKTESKSKHTFLSLIEIKEKKQGTKNLKFKILIHIMLFTVSLMPFFYAQNILNSYKNFNYFYSKKLNYFDYLNPNSIYLMVGHNEEIPNIVGYMYHILYQNELKYKITSQYGKVNTNVKEDYFEIENNKITINPKIVYKVDREFISQNLNKELSKLFLDNGKPILIYKETPKNITINKDNFKILFMVSLPFFLLLFLFKAIRFTILLKMNEKNYKKYIIGNS
ncbi:hypothetical protein baBA2_000069 [Borrelia anserina]|uniref:Uncharacterized protein n=2 Tax=Borrelia anserina TaxID=143 RepID=W5SN31_BORAN|nr:hypothetical protein [Borrelia anserina]AHH08033.1 Hypothetical protein BAN_0108000 [Borrelia anserina BA2]APR64583.1 hypothetical protein N187_00340 [Borrelia anserina Es]UPA06496.1 hypothetical protein baBA2_000069 [Borrelia anserina]